MSDKNELAKWAEEYASTPYPRFRVYNWQGWRDYVRAALLEDRFAAARIILDSLDTAITAGPKDVKRSILKMIEHKRGPLSSSIRQHWSATAFSLQEYQEAAGKPYEVPADVHPAHHLSHFTLAWAAGFLLAELDKIDDWGDIEL